MASEQETRSELQSARASAGLSGELRAQVAPRGLPEQMGFSPWGSPVGDSLFPWGSPGVCSHLLTKPRPRQGAPRCGREPCRAPTGQKMQQQGSPSPAAPGSPSTLRCFWSRLPGRVVPAPLCVPLRVPFTCRCQRVLVPLSVRVPRCVVLFVIVPTLLSGWFCVSEKDCGDGSDEKNCPKPTG